MKNNNSSIKTVVAVGIGAALFFVLGRFVAIPSPVPNTNISLQYAVLALLAAMYGPVAGGLIGFIGHTLIDLSWGGSPWWSWVIASAFVGVVVGLFSKKLNLQEGEFGKKQAALFALANIVAHLLAWVLVAPVLDIAIYAEPVKKVFAQGAFAAVSNSITAVVVGGLLLFAYSHKNTPRVFLNDTRRMLDAVGPLSMLPILLAALGSIFTAAGVGDVISHIVSGVIPQDNVVVGLVVYAVGMAVFTMVMGNAYGAITVLTVGIGAPFVLSLGADPALVGSVALTCGFCGTLMTPMAANFNILPVAILNMKDRWGAIKNQVLVAIFMLVFQICYMIVLK